MANYRSVARRKARKYGLDPDIFERQINQESGFDPKAVSPAGARGIAQIMPGTAKGWKVNPDDPVAALDAAAKNMALYVKQLGSYRKALIAYNAGPGRANLSDKDLPSETRHYLDVILGQGRSEPSGLSKPQRDRGTRVSESQPDYVKQAVVQTLISKAQNPKANLLGQLTYNVQQARALQADQKSTNAEKLRSRKNDPDEPPSGWSGNNPWKIPGQFGLGVSSGHRPGAITSSGNVSDHSQSEPGQMARDFSGSRKAMDRAARAIARELGIRNYKPGRIYNIEKDGYRYQLIWDTSDHKDHVHLGRKRIK